MVVHDREISLGKIIEVYGRAVWVIPAVCLGNQFGFVAVRIDCIHQVLDLLGIGFFFLPVYSTERPGQVLETVRRSLHEFVGDHLGQELQISVKWICFKGIFLGNSHKYKLKALPHYDHVRSGKCKADKSGITLPQKFLRSYGRRSALLPQGFHDLGKC